MPNLVLVPVSGVPCNLDTAPPRLRDEDWAVDRQFCPRLVVGTLNYGRGYVRRGSANLESDVLDLPDEIPKRWGPRMDKVTELAKIWSAELSFAGHGLRLKQWISQLWKCWVFLRHEVENAIRRWDEEELS